MSVSFSQSVSASIYKQCHSMQTQQNLMSTLQSLQTMQGMDQMFANQFVGGGNFNANSFKANFVQPGQIPQPGQLVSLSHQSYGGSVGGMNLGRMNFAQALQNSLAMNGFGNPAAMFGGGFGGMQPFGGAAGCFGGPQQWGGALSGLDQMLQQQLALGSLGHHGRMGAMSAQNTSVGTGQPAAFPPAGSSPYLSGLNSYKGNAKKLNVSGSHDVKTINKAIGQLRGAEPKIGLAKPGDKTGKGKLVLDQATVQAMRNAPNQAAAEQILRDFMGKQGGHALGTSNMNDKKGIRNDANRKALNSVLGSKIRSGREKNSASSLIMNEMVHDITKSVRGGSFGTTAVSHEYASAAVGGGCMGAYGHFSGGKTTAEFANGPSALAVDLSAYQSAAKTAAELYSPLIFDLEGQGLKLKNGGMIEVDLDGDGKTEMISELDAHIGLLVFDSKWEPEDDGEFEAAGRDMFGNGTDLSAYGIKGPQDDGSFENGFDALRALCEHFEIAHGDKQHLDADDLAVLEKEVGLRMRVGGVADGEDQTFGQVGISRINLGKPDAIQSIEQAEEDMYGNKLMRQDGATFVVNDDTRDYCDIWFNIQARAEMDDFADEDLSTSALVNMNRRI